MDTYFKTLRFEDFGFAADLVCTAAVWTRVGAITVPAGVLYAMGRIADGFAYALLKHTDAVVNYGRVRISAANPEETRKVVLLEFNTRTTTDPADKMKKIIVPLTKPFVQRDSKLICEIMPEATFTLDFGTSLASIDITVFIVQ